MGRISMNLKYEGMARYDAMRCFTESKHDAKHKAREAYREAHGNLEGWNPAKVPMKIFSLMTHHGYKDAFAVFVKYAKLQDVNRFDRVNFELCKKFLQHEISIGKSSWTVSLEMSALNKLFEFDLSKENCDLPKRLKTKIKRSRGGLTDLIDTRPGTYEANKDQITMANATGMRRQSVKNITKEDFFYGPDGLVSRVRLRKEKGGKSRISPILPEFREEVTRIVENAKPGEPIFDTYDTHINNHYLRAEYLQGLASQLSESGSDLDLDGLDCSYLGNLKGKDLNRKREAYGLDLKVAAAVSNAGGHNRLDVLGSYLYKLK